jgi:hypothetical protein
MYMYTKTTKLILLDSLLQEREIGDACLPPPPLVKWIRQTVFQIASNAESRQNEQENEQRTGELLDGEQQQQSSEQRQEQ